MAATLANAIKNLLEASGLGIDAYRDSAPNDPGVNMPFVTITEGVSITTDTRGGDGGADAQVIELVQVDVWEQWMDEDENVTESATLAKDVQRALHGAQLATAPDRAYGLYATERRRLLETSNNVVHNAITATVYRVL